MVIVTISCACLLYSWCLFSAGLEEEEGSLYCGLSGNLSLMG